MSQAIISVRRHDQDTSNDYEIALSLTAGQLLHLILEETGWPGPMQLRAEPFAVVLGLTQTLADLGIDDGASIVAEPLGHVAPPATESGAGFAWKRMD